VTVAAAHPAQDTPHGGNLLVHLLRFGDLLRLMGVETSLRQMLDLVEALEFVPISQRTDFYYAAQSLLVTHREDLPIFDQAFALFWTFGQDESSDAEKEVRKKKTPRLKRAEKSLTRFSPSGLAFTVLSRSSVTRIFAT
jgi:uncharacterized protein